MRKLFFVLLLLVAFAAAHAQAPPKKRLLALGDTHTGYTHDSIGHALAVIDHLGRQSGLYDTDIRTDSQWVRLWIVCARRSASASSVGADQETI